MKKTFSKGFALLDVAIVVAIVGIILTSIYDGAGILINAKTTDVYQTSESVSTAALAYYDKYKALPGDDPKGSLRNATLLNGNGNGRLDTIQESEEFWKAININPKSSGSYELQAQWNTYGSERNTICFNSLSTTINSWVDLKYDDGIDNQGIFISKNIVQPPLLFSDGVSMARMMLGAFVSNEDNKLVCRLLEN